MAAFKNCQDHVFFLAVEILVILLAFVRRRESGSVTVEVILLHLEVNGTTSLPDPGPPNAFLRNNQSLFNPLFPAPHPPLQLQRCNSTIYQINAFDFYTLQHLEGCGTAPGLVKDLNRARMTRKYDNMVKIWAVIVLALVTLLILVGILCPSFAAGVCGCLGKTIIPPRIPGHAHRTWVIGFLLFMFITLLGCSASFILGIALYGARIGVKVLVPAKLPDPATLNPFLSTSNQNATLYRCTIRDMFQVYVGFADSCDQLQSCIYPGVVRRDGGPPRLAHGAGVTFVMMMVSVLTYASSVMIVAGTLYCCCCCWPISRSVGKAFRECKQVRSVELQAPNGSAV